MRSHVLPNDTVDRRAQREFALARIDGLVSRMVFFAAAAALGAVFVPVPLMAVYAGLIAVTAFAEYFAAKAFLAADLREADTADLPRANVLAATHIAASISVAFAIATVWAYTGADEKVLPLSLLAIALLDTALNGCQILRLMMLRQVLFLATALAMILRDIMDPDGVSLGALSAGLLPMILLALVALLATHARTQAYHDGLLREHLLAASRDAAEKESAGRSAFVATVSHELRTQLNGVLGMAQNLQNTELTAQQRIQAEIITESGRNLNTMLNDILDLTKLEAGEMTIVPAEEDLRGTVDQIAKLYEPLATKKGLEFQVSIDAGIPDRLVFDPVRVRQCLSNLVANAIKFTAAGSVRVAVASEALGSDPDGVRRYLVTALVADTGIGIPAAQQSRLFQPYGQADASIAHRFGGTGLGLSITRQLAESMSGSVTLDSTSDKGTVFRLTFAADGTKDTGRDS